jgi:hypothetical protein
MDFVAQFGIIPTLIAAAVVITLIGWMVTQIENAVILWGSGGLLVLSLGVYAIAMTMRPDIAGLSPRELSYGAGGIAALSGQIFIHRLIKGTVESWLWALALSLAVAGGVVYALMLGLPRLFGA